MANPRTKGTTQDQERDLETEGGTAPGGTVAFMGQAAQWSSSKAANSNPNPAYTGHVRAAKMMHYGLADEAPSAKGDVPVHPGLRPGLFRTARDANYQAPDGESNDPTANDGRPASPSTGRHRGESPEVLKQTRGAYKP